MPRIYEQKHGTLNEGDRLEIARLLVKAGHTVRIGREKLPGRQTGPWVHYVEYSDNGKGDAP